MILVITFSIFRLTRNALFHLSIIAGILQTTATSAAVAPGFLRAIGRNNAGQLADGNTQDTKDPIEVRGNVTAIAASASVSLFVTADGVLWSTAGQSPGSMPVAVATDVIDVVAGRGRVFFIKNDHTLWGYGDNRWGALQA
ncbi:MAG: hypothetical protein ACREIA_25070 [Opitutaceae bacterium]